MAAATCPRCGSLTAAGPFCPRCGRYLVPLVWVASPPSGELVPPVPPRPPYAGPPRYAYLPRGGFPARPWVGSQPVADPRPTLVPPPVALLWATAVVAVVAAGAEVWRYVLLLLSRSDALDARTVTVSDALVGSAGTVATLVGLAAGVLVVRWTVRATRVAAVRAGVAPARSARAVVLGWLVPGMNLVVPGATLAEVEHCALDRPPTRRPRPSGLLLVWWAVWAGDVVLALAAVAWSLRTGVQARADGVVLHAVVDLLAATTAGTGAVLLARLTRLLAPPRAVRREIVVAVRDGARTST